MCHAHEQDRALCRAVLSSSLHMGLLGMRLQHGLEGVEIGPVLGQGSFGCVYKGEDPVAIHGLRRRLEQLALSSSWLGSLNAE